MPEALRHDRHVDPGGEHQGRLPVLTVMDAHAELFGFPVDGDRRSADQEAAQLDA
ncbi:hypothetical protein ABZ826_01440 [Streptomyces sp. NPDC047515]|uniref:hypothetical protein n=1 Tax=Streptomyces sp. NPDC047515 TaxID=3155380 RepID=UPI00340602C7